MEKLKKELQEKGYTFFRIQDYAEFKDDYENFKKYICNKEKNLLNYINGIRLDGNNPLVGGDVIQLAASYKNYEEAEFEVNKIIELKPNYSITQYYYSGHNSDILQDFEKLITKIAKLLYSEVEDDLRHLINITYYKKGCLLQQHRDGISQNRLCAILVYLNDEDYNPEWGGNIVFEGNETVAPIYGNVAILDFKNNNALHEVQKVIDGYGRYAILDFVSLGKSVDTPNYY